MKFFARPVCAAISLALGFLAVSSLAAQDAKEENPGFIVQTRGPVHEAFAQPNDLKPEPGLPVPKEPPPPIPEEPPEQRPDGDNVEWIAGYWSWDAQNNQFVWVSGVYRQPPVGRQFVPGHWMHTADGWVWIPGFWAPQSQRELPYTPEPPAPLEVEPSLPPPNGDSVYIPGYWLYRDARFAWRAGYYAPYRQSRIWVSPRYIWTPAGYLFVDGYWDYPLEERGLLFAPVCFARPYWLNAGWSYRPSYVIGVDFLLDSLFIRTRSFQFYFGNYYGPAYARAGFNPWFAGSGFGDPLFSYYRWHNRGNRDWVAGLRRVHDDRVAGRLTAPPATFAEQLRLSKTSGPNSIRPVTPLAQFQNDKVRLVKTGAVQLESARRNKERAVELSALRAKVETSKPASPGEVKTTRAPEPRTLKLPPNPTNVTIGTPATGPGIPRVISDFSPKRTEDNIPLIKLPPPGTVSQPAPKVTSSPPASRSDTRPRQIDQPKNPPPPPANVAPRTPKSGSSKGTSAAPKLETPRTPKSGSSKGTSAAPKLDPPRFASRPSDPPPATVVPRGADSRSREVSNRSSSPPTGSRPSVSSSRTRADTGSGQSNSGDRSRGRQNGKKDR